MDQIDKRHYALEKPQTAPIADNCEDDGEESVGTVAGKRMESKRITVYAKKKGESTEDNNTGSSAKILKQGSIEIHELQESEQDAVS